jgi:hypothetical protein
MIKKSIASILIILILINIVGCYPYSSITMYDTERIEKGEKFRVTTSDGTVYYLTDVEVQESIVRGKEKVIKDHIRYPDRIVEIRFEDIKSIEVEEIDVVTPILIVLGVGFIVLTAFFVFIFATVEHN